MWNCTHLGILLMNRYDSVIDIYFEQQQFAVCPLWFEQFTYIDLHSPPLKVFLSLHWCESQGYHLSVAQIEFLRWLVLIQSCNRHAICANVNEQSNAPFSHANNSYKIKSMPERKLY